MNIPLFVHPRASRGLLTFLFMVLIAFLAARAEDAPKLVQKDGRFALLVDGRPYLMLGGQIHNSSSWPSELPQIWQSMAALHANTVEAPVYWEQIEQQPGHFNFDNVDQLLEGARAHDLHVVLLWFGTWKNGNMHYVPSWVKEDPKRFPHVIRPDGEPIDVLSPHARATLEADKAAFVALMRHLKQIDGEKHTVLMIQVENESGNIGSVRDNSPESNQEFAAAVPADLLKAAGKQPGTWSQVLAARPMKSFRFIIRPGTSMKLPPPARRSSPFLTTSTCGWITQPPRCRSANWIHQASATPAAVRYRSASACGRRWPPPSMQSGRISTRTTRHLLAPCSRPTTGQTMPC